MAQVEGLKMDKAIVPFYYINNSYVIGLVVFLWLQLSYEEKPKKKRKRRLVAQVLRGKTFGVLPRYLTMGSKTFI